MTPEHAYCDTCGSEVEHFTRDGIAYELCERCGMRPVRLRRVVPVIPEKRGARGPRERDEDAEP